MIIRRHIWAVLAAEEYEITKFHCPPSFELLRAVVRINVRVEVANKSGKIMPSPGFPFLEMNLSRNGMGGPGECSGNEQGLPILHRTTNV
jgi:hypothetical protein